MDGFMIPFLQHGDWLVNYTRILLTKSLYKLTALLRQKCALIYKDIYYYTNGKH